MELEFKQSSAQLSSPKSQQRTCLQVTLLICFAVCLVIGFAALTALYLFQSVESKDGPQSSLSDLIRPEQISPQLALQQLAGSLGEPLAVQAIQAGELETAQAIVFFDTELSVSSRTALYLKLARRFVELNQPARARLVTQHGRSLAILTPQLHVDEQTSLLLQSLEIFLSEENAVADNLERARDSAIQLKRIGEQTSDLLPAERGQIFDAIRPYIRQLDDPLLFQELNELARNPFLKPVGQLVSPRIDALLQSVEPDPALAVAVANRQQAAAALISRIAQLGGGLLGIHFAPANLVAEQEAFARTLLAEEQIRTQYYQSLLSGQRGEELSLNQQLRLLDEYRAWIALKIRIAFGGFGLSILPEWEDNANLIVDELARITAQTGAVLDVLVTVQLTPAGRSRYIATREISLACSTNRARAISWSHIGDFGQRISVSSTRTS